MCLNRPDPQEKTSKAPEVLSDEPFATEYFTIGLVDEPQGLIDLLDAADSEACTPGARELLLHDSFTISAEEDIGVCVRTMANLGFDTPTTLAHLYSRLKDSGRYGPCPVDTGPEYFRESFDFIRTEAPTYVISRAFSCGGTYKLFGFCCQEGRPKLLALDTPPLMCLEPDTLLLVRDNI